MRGLFMLMIVAIVVVVLVAGLLAFAASKPDNFQVQRSTTIGAPPETIYPLISNWHNFLTWSPFEKDPAMKRKFSGAASAEGQFTSGTATAKSALAASRSLRPPRHRGCA
jgi:hypothetical protein